MSLSTSYRFEKMTQNKGLQNALQRQHDRIKTDETMASRENQAKLEAQMNLKSQWNEALQVAAARQKAKTEHKHMQSEMVFAHRASVMVRRDALKKVLENEHRMYEKELNVMGKAFYIKRT